MDRPSWYEITALADDTTDIHILNEIGFGGITAAAFVKELGAVKAGKINLHLNSPGGSLFDGLAIYNALRQHPATVTVYVDGVAASIASVIAMGGDKIVMARHSSMMIHEAQGQAAGAATDMTKMAERLDLVSDQIAGIYQERVAGSKITAWRALMKEETWFVDEQAVKFGLADEVSKKTAIKNCFDLSNYKHVPEAIVKEDKAPVEEPVEFDRAAALREAAQVSLTEVLSR